MSTLSVSRSPPFGAVQWLEEVEDFLVVHAVAVVA